jgi:hypothetical protein
MSDPTPGGWPDAARKLVEWALAIHFSGNKMPHMSGDPRNRLAPGQRRAMEDARDAVLEALAPILAAQIDAARREEREANALYCAQRQRAYEVRAADADMTVRHYTSADIAGTFAAAFESAAAAIRARGDA